MILGIKITRDSDHIILSQGHYIERMLKRFGHFDYTPVFTPYDGSIHLRKNKEESVSQSEYAQIIGSLMHLMNYTTWHCLCHGTT